MKPEVHVFVVWPFAMSARERILKDVAKRTEIIAQVEACWPVGVSPDAGYRRFYGANLPDAVGKVKRAGEGKFLIVIVRIASPRYDWRMTQRGLELVNLDMFEMKWQYREWVGGLHRVHGTNSVREARRDVMLLTGFSIDDWESGKALSDSINVLPGQNGWRDVSEMFSFLNEVHPYVILRNEERLHQNRLDPSHDIDVLAENAKECASALNVEGSKKSGTVRFVQIGGHRMKIDICDVNDGYFDEVWSRHLLGDRVLNDAVIIAAGSFKYGTQNLFMDYSLIVEIADEAKIPVFFSGMNIQPYSVTDWRCKYLKEHLNNPIVKMITTRDGQSGVDCLRNEYVTNKELAIDWVGDTGFFIKDCYAASRRSRDCVGINLIASKQFIAYGGNIKEEDVVSFYAGIISYLKEKEIPFECFTNGMPGDVKTHAKICNALGISENDVSLTIPQSDVEAVNLIASYKVVLGARLHACICAYAMDVPFVGFSWDKKILSFGKLTGTQSQFLVEDDFNAQNAIKKIMQSHDLVYDCHLREMLKQRAQNAINGFIASVKAGVKTDEKESP